MNNDKKIKRPPKGPMKVHEKPKNFKNAIKRLFSELKNFRILIFISLILAVLGSILSIVAPNRLADLTDEISKGIIVKTDNLEELTKNITKMSVVGVRVVGAIGHSVGQILIAVVFLSNINIFYYLPVLLISSVITGVIVGIISNKIIDRYK